MVTIKDVAKAANVSNMTVSRAFKEDSSIKPETRERILSIAKQMNYLPNYNAKGLVMNQQFSVGLFFSSMIGTSKVFLGDLVNEVYQLLPKNYLLSVNSIDQFQQEEARQHLQSLLGRFDGIIIATQSEADDPFIEWVAALNIPLVVMNRKLTSEELYNVYSDERQGIDELVTHLAERSIKTAGSIKGIPGFYSTEYRFNKFLERCQEEGIDLLPDAIEIGEYTLDSGYQAMQKILENTDELPEVIFCGNDDMAFGAIKACYNNKIEVPRDVSIVGFDNTTYARYSTPALTTIDKPYKTMAKQAMTILKQLIDAQQPSQHTYCFPSTLIIRNSVK